MKCFIILLFLSIQTGFSGFERTSCGARNSALGHASLAVMRDVWAVRANPGGLASVREFAIGVDYEPDPFGLSELRTLSAAFAVPTEIGNFGLAAQAFGFSLYRELSVSLAYGVQFGGIGIGVRSNFHSVSIARYGHTGAISFDAGILIPLQPFLLVGLSFNNAGGSTIGASREKLPQSFSLGASVSPLENAAIFGAYTKEPGFPATARFGLEYVFLQHATFRAGIDGEPALLCGGIGIRWNGIEVDFALTHHDELGWSQEISINIIWGGADE